MAPALTLLTAPGCHLCEHARDVLDELSGEGLLHWRELSPATAEGQALEPGLPPLRPVLLAADGGVVAYGRLSARRLRRTLAT